ncbi:MAG TPA: UDP-3-O-acyl-N-acetylglucosamine deacetylase [Candidatus Mailhella merdavium]|nr:UDP-3-O-acyl-N-acetylglucosamine deacetylase [Candidatus Mailhella merdavium]
MFQTTVARPVSFTGVGLHSGKDVQLKFQPAPVDSGIVFFAHTSSGVRRIHPRPEAVTATALATTLSDGRASVSTVEHVLAALNGLQVDNVQVHVVGGEVPIMDGSAAQVVQMLHDAGMRMQYKERKVARIRRPLSVAGEGKVIHARPHHGFYVDYTIDFPHKSIGRQRLALEITPESFMSIASARTFGFLQEVEYLHSKRLALGGSLRNAVVLDEDGIVNPEGLRCPDEFVRHKILDFIGDMAMFGMPLQGAFEVHCSGHHHNNLFLRRLQAEASVYLDVVREGEESRADAENEAVPALAMPA